MKVIKKIAFILFLICSVHAVTADEKTPSSFNIYTFTSERTYIFLDVGFNYSESLYLENDKDSIDFIQDYIISSIRIGTIEFIDKMTDEELSESILADQDRLLDSSFVNKIIKKLREETDRNRYSKYIDFDSLFFKVTLFNSK